MNGSSGVRVAVRILRLRDVYAQVRPDFSRYFSAICSTHTLEMSMLAIDVNPADREVSQRAHAPTRIHHTPSSYMSSDRREFPHPTQRMWSLFLMYCPTRSLTPAYLWYQSKGSGSLCNRNAVKQHY